MKYEYVVHIVFILKILPVKFHNYRNMVSKLEILAEKPRYSENTLFTEALGLFHAKIAPLLENYECFNAEAIFLKVFSILDSANNIGSILFPSKIGWKNCKILFMKFFI